MPKIIVKRSRPNSSGSHNTGIRLEKNHTHNYQLRGKHMRCIVPRCKAHFLKTVGE